MKKFVTAFILFVLAFLPTQIFANTQTVYPTENTYVSRGAPNQSFGGAFAMGAFHFPVEQNSFGYMLIKFPMNPIPAGSRVTRAIMHLYMQEGTGVNPLTLNIVPMRGDWNESITYNSSPGSTGIGAGSAQINNTAGDKTWDITALTTKWVDGSVPVYGFALANVEQSPNQYNKRFYTDHGDNFDFYPRLVIDYIPPGQPNQGNNNQGAAQPIIIPSPNLNLQPVGNVGLDVNLGGNVGNLTISEIKFENVSGTGVTIKWKTNRNATSWIFYGDATDGSDRFDKQTGQDNSVSNHSINLASLSPITKYSFKVFSKDGNNKQSFGQITYFTTLASGAPADPAVVQEIDQDNNIFEKVQDKLENKVADYSIQKSLNEGNAANLPPGLGLGGLSEASLSATGAIASVAGFVGLNKLAGFLFILLGLICIVGCLILYFISRKIHHHIRRHIDPAYAKLHNKKKK